MANNIEVMLLGNGFDLNHYLITSYSDFLIVGEYFRDKTCVYNENLSVYDILSKITNKSDFMNTSLSIYENTYKTTKIPKEEFFSMVEKFRENCWVNHFYKENPRETWIDLEMRIADVLASIDNNELNNLRAFEKVIFENSGMTNKEYTYTKNYILGKEICDNAFFDQFTEFVELLRLYLKVFVNNVLDNMPEIKESQNKLFKNAAFTITFNYTSSYEKLYKRNNIVHIHGDINKEIILGINSNKNDNDKELFNPRFIKYKKYYQRLTKHTINKLSQVFYWLDNKDNKDSKKFLSVIGHSLDTSDEDVITVIFEMFDVVFIYYYDDSALDKYVKNLTQIFTAKQLSKMTLSSKIVFRQLPTNEYIKDLKANHKNH